MKLDNKTKEEILNRLHKSSGFYKNGVHVLPDILKIEDVLKAINLDEYFFKEKVK